MAQIRAIIVPVGINESRRQREPLSIHFMLSGWHCAKMRDPILCYADIHDLRIGTGAVKDRSRPKD
jgi:hypothetical protein